MGSFVRLARLSYREAGGVDVAPDPPEGAGPQREVDRLEITGGMTALEAGTRPMPRVDVRAAIQQQADHLAGRCGDGAVQRSASRPVAEVHEIGVGVEERVAKYLAYFELTDEAGEVLLRGQTSRKR